MAVLAPGRGLARFAQALRNRRDAALRGALDDRLLADIGLTRSDVRDAYAEPLWRDPTAVLAERMKERRVARGRGWGRALRLGSAPSIVPDGFVRPPTDRPARLSV
jgi:uncharacterized protein YjiS (DUF1127 family)